MKTLRARRTERESAEALPVFRRQAVHVAVAQVRIEGALRIDRLVDLGTGRAVLDFLEGCSGFRGLRCDHFRRCWRL